MPKIILLTFLFFATFSSLFSQRYLSGQVLDVHTGQPIPYVNVIIKGSLSGVLGDENGMFLLPIQSPSSNIVLKISSIAYESDSFKIASFSDSTIIFKLQPKVYSISEFEKKERVPMSDPWLIVRTAVKSIPDNYPTYTYEAEGEYTDFFQEYWSREICSIQKKDVKVSFAPKNGDVLKDSITIISARKTDPFWSKFRYNEQVVLPQYHIPDFGTNHLAMLLRMNPIAHPKEQTFDFVERLNLGFTNNHRFKLFGIYTFNNHNVYYIDVYIKGEVRNTYLNQIYVKDAFPGEIHLYPSFSMGYSAKVGIGRMLINTKDFGIEYFEYCNGDLNDRYKFCAEYTQIKGKYYPVKLYFANKFKMAPHPDFSIPGEQTEYFKADKASKWYNNTLRTFSATKENRSTIEKIIQNNTIYTPMSSIRPPKLDDTREILPEPLNVPYVEARMKIAEDILDTFKYKDYGKYLHHRYLSVKYVTDVENKIHNKEIDQPTAFDHSFLFLGDPVFEYFSKRILKVQKKTTEEIEAEEEAFVKSGRKRAVYYRDTITHLWVKDTVKTTLEPDAGRINGWMFKTLKSGELEVGVYMPYVPVPITSKDEYRYIYATPYNPKFCDKPSLVKGKMYIRTPLFRDFDKYWNNR